MPGPRLDCLDTKTASTSAFFFLLSSFPPDYLDGARFRFETDDVAPAELLSRTTADSSRAPHRQSAMRTTPIPTLWVDPFHLGLTPFTAYTFTLSHR